jgi:hypothetical protein
MSKSATNKNTTNGLSKSPADGSLPEFTGSGLPQPRPFKVTDPRDREMEVSE